MSYTGNENSHFDYIEKFHGDKQDTIKTYTLDSYPKELQKKVTLLQHFRSYLLGENKAEPPKPSAKNEGRKTPQPIYVKKWLKTHHAIIFRLSNKIVQVNFKDHTEILLCSENRAVVYVNKKGERITYPLDTALRSDNAEMTKRLTYTKDLLTRMLTGNRQKTPSAEAENHNAKIETKGKPLAKDNKAKGPVQRFMI